MNQGYYSQESPFMPGQLQQTTTPQPIGPSRLSHPTNYHIQQTQLRNQKNQPDDGAPPTPSNSFTNTTIDPGLLSSNHQISQMRYIGGHIKQESPDMHAEIDLDPQNILSPLSNSPTVDSPPQHYASFDDELCRSYKAPSHLESQSPFGQSPGSTSLYSPGPETNDYYMDGLIASSAPTTINHIDVKSNPNPKFYRHPPNNYTPAQISMSLPVQIGANPEWFSGMDQSNFPQNQHANSIHYPTEMMTATFLDSDENDSAQKQKILSEKRRRRRESHNAVERRRRDNINEKIQELATLLPEMYIDSANKPNKGVILRKSVEYIRHLQQMMEQYRNRNNELEATMRDLSKSGIPIEGNSTNRSDLNAMSSSSSIGVSSQTSSLGSNNNMNS